MDTAYSVVAAFFLSFCWCGYYKPVNHYQNKPLSFGLGLETVSGSHTFALVGTVPVKRFPLDKIIKVNLFPLAVAARSVPKITSHFLYHKVKLSCENRK